MRMYHSGYISATLVCIASKLENRNDLTKHGSILTGAKETSANSERIAYFDYAAKIISIWYLFFFLTGHVWLLAIYSTDNDSKMSWWAAGFTIIGWTLLMVSLKMKKLIREYLESSNEERALRSLLRFSYENLLTCAFSGVLGGAGSSLLMWAYYSRGLY